MKKKTAKKRATRFIKDLCRAKTWEDIPYKCDAKLLSTGEEFSHWLISFRLNPKVVRALRDRYPMSFGRTPDWKLTCMTTSDK